MNGYKFSPTAFGTANDNKVRTLYEDKLVFIDHADRGTFPLNRSVLEVAGRITNVRFDDQGRPRGDIETLGTPKGDILRDLAKSGFKRIGLSHTGRYRFNKDESVVESIEEVFSVDVVVNPATTTSLRENVQVLHKDNMAEKNYEEAVEKLFSAKTELSAEQEKVKTLETKLTEEGNKIAALKTELETVKAELATLKTEKEARETREALLTQMKEAGINTGDADICPEHFIEACLAVSGATREALIKDRAAAIESGKNATDTGAKERKERNTKTESFDVNKALESEDIFA